MKDKILYIVPGYNPNLSDGVNNRVNSFIKLFKENGFEVSILDIFYIRLFKEIFANKKNYNSDAKWYFFRFINFISSRLLNLPIFFAVRLYIAILTRIYNYKFVIADYYIGVYFCKLIPIRSKIIANHRGDLVDELMYSKGCNKDDDAVKNSLYYLKKSVKVSDYTLSVSKKLIDTIESQTNTKIINYFIFPCCASVERFLNQQREPTEKYVNKIVMGYFGGLNKWQNIEIVIEIVLQLHKLDSRIYLMLLTNYPVVSIQDKLDELGSDNYECFGVQSNKMPDYIKYMDASFVLREDRLLNIVSSPTKISESLAAGVPVIATKFAGDVEETVTHNVNGYIMESISYTETDIINIYKFILKVKNSRDAFSAICKSKVKERNWSNYSKAFINFLRNN